MPIPINSLAFATIAILAAGRVASADEASALPYEPRPVEISRAARYLTNEGAVRIVGYNDMQWIFEAWNALFRATHPEIAFQLVLKGTATAAPALTFGISAMAPMGAEFSALELESYRAMTGEEPLGFRVAHTSLNRAALSGPVKVFVHPTNPIGRVTMKQLAQIFAGGGADGALTHWGQIGLQGDWAERPIVPVTIGDEAPSGGGPFLVEHVFGGLRFVLDEFTHTGSLANVGRVEREPAAIGLATDNVLSAGVKLMAVGDELGEPVTLTEATLRAGTYPLDRHLLIYVRRGSRADPLVAEYLRMVLSREGQAIVAAAPPGYLPLNRRELAAERAKLE